MANLLLPRASPPEGFSIAYKAMDDAAEHYLAHGGPAIARIELANLANGLKFYNDYMEAYQAALKKVARAEEMEHQRRLRELADFMRAEQMAAQSANKRDQQETGVLPPKLATEKAMLMWQRLQEVGYIDDCYKPVGLSRAMLTVIADEMMARIGDENENLLGFSEKWTHFEILWGKKNLRADHYHALGKGKASDFRGKIQLLFADIP